MTATRLRLHALLCALLLAVCALLVHPAAEMGMNDDFAYTRIVQLLLQTGHIHYVGWAQAMLGWQIYWGALFAKLFGFSFTTVRLSILPVGMALAWLLQRSFARCGLNERNATISALTVVLSPVFLPLCFSFMTDVPGLFCIVLCFYCCLRALQAVSDRARIAWIAFAALSNALDGTVRQSAWLCVAVMVPCLCWLLRRHRAAVMAGCLSCTISAAWIIGCLHWFNNQAYVQRYDTVAHMSYRRPVPELIYLLAKAALTVALFALPVLVPYTQAISKQTRRRAFAGVSVVLAGFLIASARKHHLVVFLLAPYLVDAVTVYGPVANVIRFGNRPVVLGLAVRCTVSVGLIVSLACLCARLLSKDATLKAAGTKARLEVERPPSAKALSILLGPMLLVYIVLLLPRGVIFDRYMLVPLPFAVLAAALFFQRNMQPCLPAASVAMVCVFALYGIAVTHDLFAMYRAFVAATEEVTASGVPRNAIDGGFEYNGWTQITETPSLNSLDVQRPPNEHAIYVPPGQYPACTPQFYEYTPVVKAQFAVSFDAAICGGPAGYFPVFYRPWSQRRSVPVYIVRLPH